MMAPVADDHQDSIPQTLKWHVNGSPSASSPTLSSVLQMHLSLSQQLSQALFTSLHAIHSTALPPAPIPRPDQIPSELRLLPVWDLPPNASPTSKELIPSLLLVHASLDEHMLQARTHLVNATKIRRLTEEVRELQKCRRERVRELSTASRELRAIVLEGREEAKKIQRARQAPLDYRQVLDYAADLARTTSAPPGYSQAKSLKDAVEAALTRPQQTQPQKASPLSESGGAMDSVHQTSGSNGVTLATIVAQGDELPKKEDKDMEQNAEGTTANGTVAAASVPPVTIEALPSTSTATATAQQPTQSRFIHSEEEADLSRASSAPQLLPFPSDAEMRRGLMGLAMLDESGAGIKSILPTWETFREQWEKEQGGQNTDTATGAQNAMSLEEIDQERQRGEQRRARTRQQVEEMIEEDLGLDLN